MNKTNFTNVGGLKTYQNVFAFEQNAMHQALLTICKAIGDNVIIEGVELAAGVLSSGLIVMGDELLPFNGGANQGYIAIQQAVQNKPYADTVSRPLYYTRVAVPATTGVPLDDFVRISTLRELAGLENAPGLSIEKSDEINLDDSVKVATPKAVNTLRKIIYTPGRIFTSFGGGFNHQTGQGIVPDYTAGEETYVVPRVHFGGGESETPGTLIVTGFKAMVSGVEVTAFNQLPGGFTPPPATWEIVSFDNNNYTIKTSWACYVFAAQFTRFTKQS
ncbi:hypothetical protein ACTJIJ_23040 [Niabella sp. 22666]|uniref:hypothetical protein n=1 Tax=Niabella sp. 22666 TaxID=3453954 RepID=UPI003F858E2C